MDKTIYKCLEFCQTSAMSNQKCHLSIGNDNFNFSHKELVRSCWQYDYTEPNMNKVTKKVTNTTVNYTCDQCEFKSISEKGLRQHIRRKHQITQVDGSCDAELLKYKDVKPNDKLPDKEDGNEDANTKHCEVPCVLIHCDENFETNNELEKHMYFHHRACIVCKKKFESFKDLDEHKMKVHWLEYK